MLRDHGSKKKYVHEMVGMNDRLDGLQGAFLAVKLPHLDTWNGQRRRHAATYRRLLSALPDVHVIEELPGVEAVYHLFVIRVKNRPHVMDALAARSIGTGIHYPIPLHLAEAYRNLGYRKGDFPVSERLADEILSLPMFPGLTEEQIAFVVEALRSAIV
jgi:dTDP-4-amino-4,6-dideoxygalactose transaminase